jgi:phosphoesterase RecJ-like protein
MTNTSERYRIGELLTAIQNADSLWLFAHISPDGDTIGSTLALKMLLERLKKPVTVYMDDVPPTTLSFLPDIYCIRRYEEESAAPRLTANTLIIALDVSSADRLGKAQTLFEQAQNSAQLDHHPTNPAFARLNVIDGDAPATAVLVYRLFEAFGLPIRREEAICLYTALATDTGNFVYQNTNAEAFRMMEKLMEAGLLIADYARRLFRCKEREHIALLGKALPTLRYFCNGEIAGMRLSVQGIRDAGATAENADGIVDYAIDAAGVKMAYFARETDTGTIKFSLRALPPYRVDGVAERFGGGGHQLAAGCTVPGPMRTAIRKIEAALQKEYHGGAQQ